MHEQHDELVAARDQMQHLVRVIVDIGSDLDLDVMLHRIVNAAMELTAARPLIGPGTIVCVDDYCLGGEAGGKGLILDKFFTSIRAEVLHSGYQKIWLLS